MIDFFNWVDSNEVYEVSIEQLNKIFKEKTDTAIEFMQQNHLLGKVKQKIINYEGVTVVSNDEIFINSMKFNSNGHNEKFTYELLPRDLSSHSWGVI